MNRPILTDMASASKQGASQHCNLGGCLAWCQGLQLCVHFALCDVVSVISDDCVSEGKMQGNFGGTGACSISAPAAVVLPPLQARPSLLTC